MEVHIHLLRILEQDFPDEGVGVTRQRAVERVQTGVGADNTHPDVGQVLETEAQDVIFLLGLGAEAGVVLELRLEILEDRVRVLDQVCQPLCSPLGQGAPVLLDDVGDVFKDDAQAVDFGRDGPEFVGGVLACPVGLGGELGQDDYVPDTNAEAHDGRLR